MDTSTPLHTLDFVLRVGLVTLMLFVGAMVWRDRARVPEGCARTVLALAAALAVGVAAYALQSSFGFMAAGRLFRVSDALFADALFDQPAPPSAIPSQAATAQTDTPADDPTEAALVTRLQALMQADRAYRQEALTIAAMDAGFQSLGPFNRAFKAETGQTPTEFRKTSLA